MKPILKYAAPIAFLLVFANCNKETPDPVAPPPILGPDKFAIAVEGIPMKDNQLVISTWRDPQYPKTGGSAWDLGDGSPGVEGDTIVHTYTQDGTYTIKLNLGGKEYTKKITIDNSWMRLGDKRNWRKILFRTHYANHLGSTKVVDTLYKSDTSFALSLNGAFSLYLPNEKFRGEDYNMKMYWDDKMSRGEPVNEYFDGYSYFGDFITYLRNNARLDYYSAENKIYIRRDMTTQLSNVDTTYTYIYTTK